MKLCVMLRYFSVCWRSWCCCLVPAANPHRRRLRKRSRRVFFRAEAPPDRWMTPSGMPICASILGRSGFCGYRFYRFDRHDTYVACVRYVYPEFRYGKRPIACRGADAQGFRIENHAGVFRYAGRAGAARSQLSAAQRRTLYSRVEALVASPWLDEWEKIARSTTCVWRCKTGWGCLPTTSAIRSLRAVRGRFTGFGPTIRSCFSITPTAACANGSGRKSSPLRCCRR